MTYWRRHVEAQTQYGEVTIIEPATARDLAIVRGQDFEWLSEQDMPSYFAGSR